MALNGAQAQIFYNPEDPDGPDTGNHRYTTPTDYSADVTDGAFTAYMLVNTVDDLQELNTNLDGTYALGRDIDASQTRTWNVDDVSGEAAGFVPIGTENNPFTGRLNGQGHVIDGLFINRQTDNVGLFGRIGVGVEVLHVGLENVEMTGASFVGGLAGMNDGTLEHVFAIGSVNGSEAIGGLVGQNVGNIQQVYATGSISANDYVGGLVGSNIGTIMQAYATGSVSGEQYVGGLVSLNDGTIQQAYATGSVSGDYRVGGLVGWNKKTIQRAYATGAVNGTDSVGGLVGSNAGTIDKAYATGAVSGSEDIGGLSGDNLLGTITASYWNTETSGMVASAGGTGLTTADMTTPESFSGWDFANTWGVLDGVSYPYFRWRYLEAPHVVSGTPPADFGANGSVGMAKDGASFDILAGANGFYYALLDPGDTTLLYVTGDDATGNLVFRSESGQHTALDAVMPNAVRVVSGSGEEAFSNARLFQTLGGLEGDAFLYEAGPDGQSIVVKADVDFVLHEESVYTLDGGIQTDSSGSGDILLHGRVHITADRRLFAGNGRIVLGEMSADEGPYTLTLKAGSGGIHLSGPVEMGGGDLVLDSQGEVTQHAAITARGLALLGENGDFTLTHAGNTVSLLVAEARNVNYEQTGSLTIGHVGETAGILATDRVFVRTIGDASDLTLDQPVTAHGEGYAVAFVAGRRFVNQASTNPINTPKGTYLVYAVIDGTLAMTSGPTSIPTEMYGSALNGIWLTLTPPALPGGFGDGADYTDPATGDIVFIDVQDDDAEDEEDSEHTESV